MDAKLKARTLTIVGILLIGVNFLVLAPFVAGQVETGVGEVVQSGYDGLDDDGEYDPDSDYGDDWKVSHADRVYFAYSITNADALNSAEASMPEFTKMGPFIYNVTTTREILDFDSEAGTITYSEYDSFAWCEDCVWTDDAGTDVASEPGTTEISNINILWNTQRIAGIATGIEYGEIFAKAGYAQMMLINDLQNRAPSIWASEEIDLMVPGASAALQQAGFDEATADAMAPAAVLQGAYDNWLAQSGADDASPDFAASAQSILYDAVDPSTGICIALTCDIGPMLVAGMGEPSETTTPARAALFGYGSTDPVVLAHMDWAVYALAGTTFVTNGGGADLETATDLRERLAEVSGVDIANPEALNNILWGSEGSSPNNGILSVSDFQGVPLYGVALFLLGAQSDAFGTMVTYGIGLTQLLGLSYDWAGLWIDMVGGVPLEFEMILVGGTGTMGADSWWQHSFGSEEPIAGGYIPIGLNRGDYEGEVSLSVEKVREILYDSDYALTGDFASIFMYAELSGESLPTGADGLEMGGVIAPWNDAAVASLYGISESDAAALRSWVSDFMFEEVIGALLSFQYGATAITTQSISNWLYGWSDAVLVGLFDEESSWVSLETDDTYYGSENDDRPNGMSTGDFSVYVMSTGTGAHAEDGTTGQRLLEGYLNSDGDGLCDFKLNSDGSADTSDEGEGFDCAENEIYGLTEHLPWRAPHREASTLGLLSDHVGNANTVVTGTIGGIASADESFKVNLVGYAITESVPGEMEEYKGIPMRAHTVDLDPAQHQIQAKLIGSGTFVDVLPGALPVYFGSHVDIKVEPVTNVAMYGKSVSMFHFDLRGPGNMNPDFSDGSTDTHPVFEIHTFSEIPDDSAEIFKCKVLHNLGPMGWSDFGGSGDCELEGTGTIDMVAAVLYIVGIALLAYGGMMMVVGRSAKAGSLLAASENEE